MSDFLRPAQGPDGISFSTPQPILGEEGYSSIIPKLAQNYSETAMNAVKQSMGARGTLGSSGYASALEGAFRYGFDLAVGDVQRERDMFAKWAATQLDYAMSIGPEEQDMGPFGGALMYGISGAAAGGQIGGPWGAGIGGGLGALYGLLSSN